MVAAKARLAAVGLASVEITPTPITGKAFPEKPQTKEVETTSARRCCGAIWFTTCKLPR
jgi:hypothetical protein